jgi:predicted transcriptional regulator
LIPGTVKLLHHEKEKEKPMGIKRVAGLAGNRLLMRVDNSTGKGTSGMDKLSSEVHKVHMHK